MGKIFDVKESAVVRAQVMDEVQTAFPDAFVVGAGAFAVPVADGFAKIIVQVPKGPRGGDGWDPEIEAELFAQEQAEKAEKAKEREAKKQAKIAKDKAAREAKAKAQS